MLFYDPILSADSTISCMSCHLQFTAFAHVDHKLSHGIGDSIGTRNAPSLQNLAWHQSFMWDGAIHYLDQQALAPITHPGEMGETLPALIIKLKRHPKYPVLFKEAFGSSEINGERILKSLAQFQLTFVSSNSKYDQVMIQKSGVNFTEQEKRGLQIFRTHCESCHTEPLFTNNEFRNNGLNVDSILKDSGRMKITGKSSDSLLFKVPTLRNIEYSFPYMHDGRFSSLSMVIKHYNSGLHHYVCISEELRNPIGLSPEDRVDLLSFLLTLSDTCFLFNQSLSFPREEFR